MMKLLVFLGAVLLKVLSPTGMLPLDLFSLRWQFSTISKARPEIAKSVASL